MKHWEKKTGRVRKKNGLYGFLTYFILSLLHRSAIVGKMTADFTKTKGKRTELTSYPMSLVDSESLTYKALYQQHSAINFHAVFLRNIQRQVFNGMDAHGI